MSRPVTRFARWMLGILGAVAIAAAVLTTDSPTESRLRRIDEHRVSDLQQLSAAIDVYRSRTGALPATTDGLSGDGGLNVPLRDPASNAPYEYRVVGDGTTYELCATFDREDAQTAPVFWSHGAGRTCFTLTPRRARP